MDGDIDIAIVYTEPRVTDAIHDLLWMVRATILCSPKLLQRIDRPDPAQVHRLLRSPARQDRGSAAPFLLGDDGALDRAPRSVGRSRPGVRHGATRRAIRLVGEGLALADPELFRRGNQGRPAGAPVRYLARRGLRLLPDHPSRGPQQRGGRAVPLLADRALLGAAQASRRKRRARQPRRRGCARPSRPRSRRSQQFGMSQCQNYASDGASLPSGRRRRAVLRRRHLRAAQWSSADAAMDRG